MILYKRIFEASRSRNLHRDLHAFAVQDRELQDKGGREWESRQCVGTMFRANYGLLQDLQNVGPGRRG